MAGGESGGRSNPVKTSTDHSHVIVALPAPNESVWRFSSEKKPHMTMLFLGSNLENVHHVEQYIGHVANKALPRFGMDVERRGTLGKDSADVLFFGEHGRDRLDDIRSYLLEDPDIFKAYHSAEQFPAWIPHLTMGFPETPAKPDDREYPGISWVNFDRIALWTADYEGVEFQLKDDQGLSMSDRGEAYLKHYGIKGMKWGVRRADPDATAASNDAKLAKSRETDRRSQVADKLRRKKVLDLQSSKDAKDAGFVKTKAKVSGVNSLSNQDLQSLITRMSLERQYKDLKQVEHAESYVGAGKKWAGNFLNDVLKDAAASWLKRPGSNASGRTSARAYSWGNQIAGSISSPVQRRAIGS